MKSKMLLLISLLFINVCLTIYVIYKCFNNKIIEGRRGRDPTGISGRVRKTGDKVEKTFNSGVDAATQEANRIAEETRRETERIAEEVRRATERFVLDSFEKLLGPINIFFSTLQNTTSLLGDQCNTIGIPTQNNLRAALRESQGNSIRGGGGRINRLTRQAEVVGDRDIEEETSQEAARLEAVRRADARLEDSIREPELRRPRIGRFR
jgi:hypothetical protein